jgi:hypothetical protein
MDSKADFMREMPPQEAPLATGSQLRLAVKARTVLQQDSVPLPRGRMRPSHRATNI